MTFAAGPETKSGMKKKLGTKAHGPEEPRQEPRARGPYFPEKTTEHLTFGIHGGIFQGK